MSLFRGAVILKYLPFATHFERRMEIFVEWCRRDRAAHADPNEFGYITSGLSARIRRGHIFEDGYMRLNVPSRDSSILKRRIVIEFIDQFGLEEAGIDAGGVFKEFLTSLVAEAFQPNAGLFKATADQLLYPNPGAYAQDETHLGYMTFLGKMVGKALYEQLLIDIEFTTFFLAKWLGRRSYLDDLPSLDPTLYKGLLYLKSAPDAAELELTFSIDEDEFGVSKTFDLIPNGRTIAVTNANRLRYIYLVADYRLNREIEAQCRAFFSGLSALLRPEWLRIFNTRELQIMLSGAPGVPIDVEDLRQNTLYTGVYDQDHPTIRLFWAWFANQTDDIRRQFTRFATSCSRPPLLGFKDLVPLFCIRDAGTDLQRLPTASTCVNLLKLPQYTTYEQLAAQMEKAVTSNAGFDLS
ncbi:hypothetical protein CXG81DRAFT_13056 [Caulochytrium protostelioides]|uniref:HECT-type E3 ubiquitin transferase n=1 Tax=Caulochytrium protostelioides TaxID=1555241 RepID=A0A4P9X5X4_9FUNG|nr:HECT-domain-containing protein [Caulochytrium protostelioides]RKP00567.1 hypothetical protein CXG81DRAFT_13056 [Caulochytrium protostelioides]|eukprot:RKP00567.1 hypothetical protein CXG81DRAFT_13056 [Caulochytrium protostelioides]